MPDSRTGYPKRLLIWEVFVTYWCYGASFQSSVRDSAIGGSNLVLVRHLGRLALYRTAIYSRLSEGSSCLRGMVHPCSASILDRGVCCNALDGSAGPSNAAERTSPAICYRWLIYGVGCVFGRRFQCGERNRRARADSLLDFGALPDLRTYLAGPISAQD
jgi:hypothetical protein